MTEPGTTPRKPGFWRATPEVAWRVLVFLIAIAILILVTTRWNIWQGRRGWQATDDAYLQADFTPLSAKVAGYVREVPVRDFERVHAGQLIVHVVDDDYRAAVAQGEAGVAAAKAQLEVLRAQRTLQQANVDAARAVAASTAALLDQNRRDLARQRTLLETGSSSTETSEKLRTTRAQLAAQLKQNQAQTNAAQRQLGVLSAQEQQQAAAIAAQEASLQLSRINLGYTRIVAPQDGVLGQRQVRPGQFVGVGGQVNTLTPLPNVWVVANYKETQLTHMAVGQPAEIDVDSFPGRTMKGHVQSFAPGTGAQFALLPPDNATGNFTKVVQRVAVKIVIDDSAGLSDRLKAGMSVIARIDAREGRR
jgi:membrane fusion protein (multidrug efflux system)